MVGRSGAPSLTKRSVTSRSHELGGRERETEREGGVEHKVTRKRGVMNLWVDSITVVPQSRS
jgi:hypothetical protein